MNRETPQGYLWRGSHSVHVVVRLRMGCCLLESGCELAQLVASTHTICRSPQVHAWRQLHRYTVCCYQPSAACCLTSWAQTDTQLCCTRISRLSFTEPAVRPAVAVSTSAACSCHGLHGACRSDTYCRLVRTSAAHDLCQCRHPTLQQTFADDLSGCAHGCQSATGRDALVSKGATASTLECPHMMQV
jgi:hypothetical protein